MQLISSLKSRNIDPFHRFEGERYKLLIPMHNLQNFAYVPSYGATYRKMGITDITYGVNPTMYGALYKLNKLAGIWGVRYNVREAWRPKEWQEELYEREQRKDPGSTRILKPEPGKNLGHVAGDAVDLDLAQPTKEYWYLKDCSYCSRTVITYECWPFKAYPQPNWETANTKWQWIEPPYTADGKKWEPEHCYVWDPKHYRNAHLIPSAAAPDEFRLRIELQDFAALMRRNIPNMRNINDESWHSQGWSKDREYSDFPNISLRDVLGVPESRVREVKKEVENWAEATFEVMYDMPYEKGVPYNFSTDDFSEQSAIHLDWQQNNLALIANRIRRLAEGR